VREGGKKGKEGGTAVEWRRERVRCNEGGGALGKFMIEKRRNAGVWDKV